MKVTQTEVGICRAGPVLSRFEFIDIVSENALVPNDARLFTDEMSMVYLWRRLSNVLIKYILLGF